ncbi:MAG: hypothetical protein OXH24_03635, partial [Cyanobacteria bacterium MAG IRC3_bin_20]|nr:hypothetical protein [Cyanobacteria bacterium MAG IRC3_bin_20]
MTTSSDGSPTGKICNQGGIVSGDTTSKSIGIVIRGDTEAEPDETIVGTLSFVGTPPAGVTLGTSQATHKILNDDKPSISIAPKTANTPVTEGSDAVFTVTADAAPTSNLAVSLTVADAPNADFIDSHAEGSRTVTIKAGKTSEIFSVWARGDQVDEPSEDVKVTVAGGTGYTVSSSAGSATVKVNDDDATRVSLTTPDTTATEGSSTETASVVLTLGRPLRAGESLGVPLGFSGGAVGTDFTLALSGSPTGVALSGNTVTFTGSATVATVLLSASQDLDALDETVTVSIPSSSTGGGTTLTATGLEGGATGSHSGNGQIVLSDDDGTPASVVITESGSGTTVAEYTDGTQLTDSYEVKLATQPTHDV